jgi:hypothetical protein
VKIEKRRKFRVGEEVLSVKAWSYKSGLAGPADPACTCQRSAS